MHKYMKAIGFGEQISEAKMKRLEEDIMENFTSHERRIFDPDTDYSEYRKEVGERLQLAMYGMTDLDEKFEKDYTIPIFIGKGITSYADIIVEKN